MQIFSRLQSRPFLLLAALTFLRNTALAIPTSSSPPSLLNKRQDSTPPPPPTCPQNSPSNDFWACGTCAGIIGTDAFGCIIEAIASEGILIPAAAAACAAQCEAWGPAAYAACSACFVPDLAAASQTEANPPPSACFPPCEDCHPGGPRPGDPGYYVPPTSVAQGPASSSPAPVLAAPGFNGGSGATS